MYIRTVTRHNKDGSTVRYLQLAHNERDPQSGVAKAKVLYNFGRAEDLDREALRRLVRSIDRFLEPEDRAKVLVPDAGLTFTAARAFGGTWTLDGLWRSLGIDHAVQKVLRERHVDAAIERVIFAMVANRALAPASKLSTVDWMTEVAAVPGWPSLPLPEDAADRAAERKRRVNLLYRAMDALIGAEPDVQQEVFWSVSGGDLLDLEVDLLYFDTTNVYFEIDEEDEDDPEAGRTGLRKRGRSKEKRDDLPLVSIGLAVTRTGIPIRCWVWPGNTADVSVIDQVKHDLIGWRLGRVVTVVDRGFTSEENLKALQLNGGHYIAGAKMRAGKDANRALARQGRYQTVRDNVEVKEVVVGDGEARHRYVLVRNPAEVEHDRKERERILKQLREELAALGQTEGAEHTKKVCALRSHALYERYLTTDAKGRLKIDAAKVRAEARLDGKYLLRTSDDTLSAEDVALGYKQLLEVEDAFRTLKTTLELRPVYHRLEERIRSHVLLCWLALLLVRVIEHKTGRRWPAVRHDLEQMHLIEYRGAGGLVHQRTETTTAQRQVLTALKLAEPPQFPLLLPSQPTAS